MGLSRINDPHAARVVAVLRKWLAKAESGEVPSVLLIAEEVGQKQPVFNIAGRFRADPSRAIGPLAVAKLKVTDYAADLSPGFEPSMM